MPAHVAGLCQQTEPRGRWRKDCERASDNGKTGDRKGIWDDNETKA